MIAANSRLTHFQLELLKGIRHLRSEEQISEEKTLLNLYFREKLNDAIQKEEQSRGYVAKVYSKWLKTNSG
jgi:hypothetical protein